MDSMKSYEKALTSPKSAVAARTVFAKSAERKPRIVVCRGAKLCLGRAIELRPGGMTPATQSEHALGQTWSHSRTFLLFVYKTRNYQSIHDIEFDLFATTFEKVSSTRFCKIHRILSQQELSDSLKRFNFSLIPVKISEFQIEYNVFAGKQRAGERNKHLRILLGHV